MKCFFLIVTVFFFCTACNNNTVTKAIVPATPPVYFFYPRANVYYDTVSKEYSFLSGDGKTWQHEKQIPAAMQTLMDKHVFIEAPSHPVWKDNERHKMVYSAVLYTSPADTQTIKQIKPVVKSETPKPDEKKKRSGIRRFFDKIFGRKKKDSVAQ